MIKLKYLTTLAIAVILMLGLPAQIHAINLADSKFLYPEYSKKISMDFENAKLNDVLKIFSQQSGLNFISSQGIADRGITLYLDQVPVEEALERILHANDLTYEILPGSDIFVVKSLDKPDMELVTRVYKLQYATVSTSKINETFKIQKVGESEEESSESGGGGGGSEAAAGMLEALKSVLTSNGTIIEDPRTNSLVITDIATQFPVIDQTIAKLDAPALQILIEVEMLDVSKVTGDQLGVRFGQTPLVFSGGQRAHIYPWNQNDLLQTGRFAFGEGTGDPEFQSGTLDARGLSATLQFLKTQTDTKNLARPRILTLNNESAEITISTNEAIGTSTVTTGEAAGANTTIEAERALTGVFLVVTPQANPITGEVVLAVAPSVIEARAGQSFGGVNFRDPEARGSKSMLRVRSGDTIMLGGLVRIDNSDVVTKLPFLGDMPIIGTAFRHRNKSKEERELIIFITPHIVDRGNQAKLIDSQYKKITREQDIPQRRRKEIERALANYE